MVRDNDWVAEQIAKKNEWYTASQFAWAEKPHIKRIYAKRFEYFSKCIEAVRLRSGSPLNVLDAGCGDGYWLLRLNEISELNLSGIELNPLRMERAQKAAPHASVSLESLVDIKDNKQFDVLLLSQVIEHIEDDVGLLKKIRELITPRGCLILGTPNEGSFLHRYWREKQGESFATDHIHFYREKEIRNKIQSAGFSINSTMREVFFPGHMNLFYRFTKRGWGFSLLELLTKLYPWECSDFYFECRPI